MMSRPIAIFALFIALPLAIARAGTAAPDANATSCVITQTDLDAVTASEASGLTAELAARRALLIRTIGCAKDEAQTREDDLNALKITSDEETLRSQLLNKLGDAENYYDIELAKLNGAGIAGTKAVAREMYDWRQANYIPLAKQIADFALWSENQDLFATAATRLDQTKNVVTFVTQAVPNSDLQNAFASASALVQAANEENLAAGKALLQFLPPDQSLTLIQQSLQSLSDAYKKFSDVNGIVQTLLPTNK
jgi:hypothetical protein